MPLFIRRFARWVAVLGWVCLWAAGSAAAAGGGLPGDADAPLYPRDVAPILDARCVVCHACYDAPCQLNLGSWQGIARGASKWQVYDGARLTAAPPTRLFVDAQAPDEWRALDFHPVLAEGARGAPATDDDGLLLRVLLQKARQPLPGGKVLPDSFDFSLNRNQTCPRADEYDRYAEGHPWEGMPYGLPGLTPREHDVIARWIRSGARLEPDEVLPAAVRAEQEGWERFLNGAAKREQLMARYLFEHLFLGHLYLEHGGRYYWFRLQRSHQPPGEVAEPIATRQPFEDPGEGPLYYRLVPLAETLVAKTHMPYRLDPARMARWRALFLDGQPPIDALPDYQASTGANPFVVFRDIPLASRYAFLLDDAAYFVDGFIKGPVCRGQVALNVINDRFWVFFAAPFTHTPAADAFLARHAEQLQLPGEAVSAVPLVSWNAYRAREAQYLKARASFLRRTLGDEIPLDMTVIWDGEERNPNASLTVFRHFDSASVVQGLVGGPPKTAWLITYPILERIHYLLVAGFDVFGNVGHQLNSRLYMDFLRMEAETNLIALLPRSMRAGVIEHWYRGDSEAVKEKFFGDEADFGVETAIRYRSPAPLDELYRLLQERVAPVQPRRFAPTPGDEAVARLGGLQGAFLEWLPELAFLHIDDAVAGARDYTLLRNSAHTNISHLFAEQSRRVPDEDSLTLVPGFLGAHPNAFYRMARAELASFAADVVALDGAPAYARLADRFAVRRTDPGFWAHLDRLHAAARQADPLGFGLFDLNRLENR